MIIKNSKITLVLGVVTVFVISSLAELPNSFAEDDEKYNMAENVYANFNFNFRDGVGTYQFPVFKMTSEFISNDGTNFENEGIVGKSPYLHQALDDALKYRTMIPKRNSFEFYLSIFLFS